MDREERKLKDQLQRTDLNTSKDEIDKTDKVKVLGQVRRKEKKVKKKIKISPPGKSSKTQIKKEKRKKSSATRKVSFEMTISNVTAWSGTMFPSCPNFCNFFKLFYS